MEMECKRMKGSGGRSLAAPRMLKTWRVMSYTPQRVSQSLPSSKRCLECSSSMNRFETFSSRMAAYNNFGRSLRAIWQFSYSDEVNLLYVLADNGFSQLIRAVQRPEAWLRLPREAFQYPVIAASANGHQDALRALLGEDGTDYLDFMVADPGFGWHDQCDSFQDPLQWAGAHMNWAFAEFLLSNFADNEIFSFSKKTEEGETLLYQAAYHGSTTIVQMLLDRNMDVNAQGGHHGNALQAASLRGNEKKIVQML